MRKIFDNIIHSCDKSFTDVITKEQFPVDSSIYESHEPWNEWLHEGRMNNSAELFSFYISSAARTDLLSEAEQL